VLLTNKGKGKPQTSMRLKHVTLDFYRSFKIKVAQVQRKAGAQRPPLWSWGVAAQAWHEALAFAAS
jgi:hypothetical protein